VIDISGRTLRNGRGNDGCSRGALAGLFLSTWVLTVNGQRLNTLSVDDL
jgi:hypothetical protein